MKKIIIGITTLLLTTNSFALLAQPQVEALGAEDSGVRVRTSSSTISSSRTSGSSYSSSAPTLIDDDETTTRSSTRAAASSTASRVAAATKCKAGTYGTNGEEPCTTCSVGSFSDEGSTSCSSCSFYYPGYTATLSGNSSVCNVKVFCDGHTAGSIPTNSSAATEILDSNYRCFRRIPTTCNYGYTLENSATVNATCKKFECPAGQTAQGTTCVKSYCVGNSTAMPVNASASSEILVTDCYLTIPTGCKTGFTLQNGGTKEAYCKQDKVTCQAGEITVGNVCQKCGPGTAPDQSGTTCPACTEGTYSAGGVAQCTVCPTGTTSAKGATSLTSCYPTTCQVGQYLTGSGTTTKCVTCPDGQTSDGKKCYPKTCPAGQKLTGTGTAAKCEACPANYTSDGKTCYISKCENNDYELVNAGTVNAKCEKKGCPSGQVLSGGKCVCASGKKTNPNSKDQDQCFTEKIPYNASNQSIVTSWDYIEAGDILYKVPKSCKTGNILCQQSGGEWKEAKIYTPNEHSKCDTSCNKTTATATISAPATSSAATMGVSRGLSGKNAPAASSSAKVAAPTRGGTTTSPAKAPVKAIPNRR